MAKAKKVELTKQEAFTELEQDIVDFFNERLETFSIPIDLNIYFQSNKKQKQLIKLSTIPDHYSVIIGKDLLVSINCDYFDKFNSDDTEINTILFDQAIDTITYNMDKGTFKIVQPKLKASKSIVEKYTFERVERAYEVESLYNSQKSDDES